jgi:hypothetical protein
VHDKRERGGSAEMTNMQDSLLDLLRWPLIAALSLLIAFLALAVARKSPTWLLHKVQSQPRIILFGPCAGGKTSLFTRVSLSEAGWHDG